MLPASPIGLHQVALVSEKPKDSLYQITVNSKSQASKFKWNKKKYCKFCLKGFPKLPRNFEQCHQDESKVQKLMSLAKNSKERADLLEQMRRAGNFMHNRLVLNNGFGELETKKRVKRDATVAMEEYLMCPGCKDFFKASYFYIAMQKYVQKKLYCF